MACLPDSTLENQQCVDCVQSEKVTDYVTEIKKEQLKLKKENCDLKKELDALKN